MGKSKGEGLLPTFFIVGPPRTGTSWLHEILSSRAHLPGPIKETRFFDVHFHRGLGWYRAHYPNLTEGRCMGEISPTYFAAPEARERMVRVVPQARIVCIFRNPVARVFSHYRIKRAYGMFPWSFEQAICRDRELIESSKYVEHLTGWRRLFGTDQILVTTYDELLENPQSYLDSLADFIGMPRFSLSRPQMARVHTSETMTYPRSYQRTRSAIKIADWLKARRLDRVVALVKRSPLRKLCLGGGPPMPGLSEDLALKLYELFRPEIEELETMTGRQLSAWKTYIPPTGTALLDTPFHAGRDIRTASYRVEPATNG